MKKQWISVKCGLSRDPKHRRQMGKSVWTFLHMLDLADWETGIVYDWKDENAAEDMGIDIRVLREDRRKLDDEGYITCQQKQYSQDIYIHNWTNPREYSGEVRNQKEQGGKKPPPSDFQGNSQGYGQGSVKDVTPTSYSKNKEQQEIIQEANQKVDAILGFEQKAQGINTATISFESSFGFGTLPWGAKPEWVKFEKWVNETLQADPNAFRDYVKWRKEEGKYKGAMTNTAIRRDPQIFIDTGYPTFLADTAVDWQRGKAAQQEKPKAFPTLVNGRVVR